MGVYLLPSLTQYKGNLLFSLCRFYINPDPKLTEDGTMEALPLNTYWRLTMLYKKRLFRIEMMRPKTKSRSLEVVTGELV